MAAVDDKCTFSHKPRKLWIDSTPFTPEGYKSQDSNESPLPRVKLTHFTTKPVIDFGNVKVGKTVTRKLIVENPNLYDVDVSVEKFPWKKNFSINEEKFTIDDESIYTLEITWTPTDSGNCRELVMMKYDSGFRVHALLIGHVDSPKKKLKIKTRRGRFRKKVLKKSDSFESTVFENSTLQKLDDNTENIEPCSLLSNKTDQDATSRETMLSLGSGSPVFETPTKLNEKLDFVTSRAALLPLHVVNGDNPRDSCGSVTAPASPSGLDAPIIQAGNSSPADKVLDATLNSENTGQLSPKSSSSVLEPQRQTFCIDPKHSQFPDQTGGMAEPQLTGRPTYVVPPISKQKTFVTPAKTQPTISVSDGATPRSHRRSRTFTKKVFSEPKADDKKKIDMLDYALGVIGSDKKIMNESQSSADDSLNATPKKVSLPLATPTPQISHSTEFNTAPPPADAHSNMNASPNNEIVERLSSTHAHEPIHDTIGCLPVPDISVITSNSPLKATKRKSAEFSPRQNPPISSKRAALSPPEDVKASTRKTKPAKGGVYGTPKGRALQRRRAARSSTSETLPIPKLSGESISKRASGRLSDVIKSKKPTRKSPSLTAKRTIVAPHRQRSVKRRKAEMPVTHLVLKSSQNVKSPLTVRMPYTSRNRFYDERWRQKQESAYTTWLNYVLTPDEFKPSKETNTGTIKGKNKPMHHSETFSQKSGDKCNVMFPALSKEKASLRAYRITKRLNQLRQAAEKLFESEKVCDVIQKVEEAVESGRIKLRSDKQLWADIGNKGKVLDLLLSFNPLWLRMGLEVTFGQEVNTHANTDTNALSNFISRKLLRSLEIEKKYAHPTVPNSFRQGYTEEVSRHILKRFLILVYFLNHAKEHRLIDHDPCLFRKEADYRNCKDILISFSRDLLRGEGDIVKHLSFLGYKVDYQQTFIDEFEFGISNIAIDLRDGIRLVRIVELLFHRHDLTSKLRVPARSLLQKKHNINIALVELEARGVEMTDGKGKKIEADHIVRGHCEMTLALLWNIALHFQIEQGIDQKLLEGELKYLKKNLRLKQMMEDNTNQFSEHEDSAGGGKSKAAGVSAMLLEWCRLVCAFKSIPVYNFGASFADGRILACLVSHYQSNLIHSTQISMKTTMSKTDPGPQLDDSTLCDDSMEPEMDHAQLTKNEKQNLKLVQNAAYEMGGIPNLLKLDDICNTIPDDKVVRLLVSFLCMRLLDIGSEDRAARTIQVAWRASVYKKKILAEKKAAEELLEKKRRAATIIQATYKGYKARSTFTRMKDATVLFQRMWRSKREVRPHREHFLKLKSATILAQSLFRSKMARKVAATLRKERAEEIFAACKIQNFWRGKLLQKEYRKKWESVIKIQNFFRSWRATKLQRVEYLAYKAAVIKVQIRWRETLEMRKQVAIFSTKKEAAIIIQRAFRAYQRKKKVAERKKAELYAAQIIQQKWKATLDMRRQRQEFLSLRSAAVSIQSHLRSYLARETLSRLKKRRDAATKIQRKWRATVAMRLERNGFVQLRSASVIIQTAFRRLLAKKIADEIRRRRDAAMVIQIKWKATLLMKRERERFIFEKRAAVTIQSRIRRFLARKLFLLKRKEHHAASVIQTHWKARFAMKRDRSRFLQMKRSAVVFQSAFRAMQACRQLQELKRRHSATIVIQRRWRATVEMHVERKKYLMKKTSAMVIRRNWRRFSIKKYLRTRRTAATLIQIKWRAVSQMKIQRARFLKVKCATVKLQSIFRCILAKRQLASLRRQRDAVMTIQRKFRATLLMKNARTEFLRKRKAVIVVQCFYRSFAAKKIFSDLKIRRDAAKTIQRKWRATLFMRKERKDYLRTRDAVLRIQSAFRCYTARVIRFNLKRRQDAALIIQRKWKATMLMRRTRSEYIYIQENRTCAALIIQKRWRATHLMKKERNDFLEKRGAAIVIECATRCFLAKLKLSLIKKRSTAARFIQNKWRATLLMRTEMTTFHRKRNAVVVMQCAVRCFLARRKVSLIKKRSAAAKIIQNRWTATLCMLAERKKYLQTRNSVIKIQSGFKCILAQKTVKKMRRRLNSAVTIQRKWKATLLMREQRNDFLQLRQFAVMVQRTWRGVLLTRQSREHFLKVKNAINTIQRSLKCYLARRKLAKMQRQDAAARIIQTKWRAMLLMKGKRNKFLQLKQSIIKVQNAWHAMLSMKRDRIQFLNMKNAAIKIQTGFRCYLAQKKAAEMQRQDAAALKIQSKWRATVLMRRKRKEFLQLKQSTIRVQRTWHGMMLMRRERRHYLRIKNATIVIQCAFRCYSAGKKVAAMRRQDAAVRKIQVKWRATLLMNKKRDEFLQIKQSVIKIQSAWCGVLSMRQGRNHFLRVKYAIISIQSAFKCYLARKKVAEMRQQDAAARKVQVKWRAILLMRAERNKFLQLKQSVIKIQSAWRGVLSMRQSRDHFLKVKNAIITIQSAFKCYLARKKVAEMQQQDAAARKIQVKWRATLLMRAERNNFLQLKQSAINIQNVWRGVLSMRQSRDHFLKVKNAIITIQSAFKCYLARKKVAEMRQQDAAVRKIQVKWRAALLMRAERNNFLQLKQSAIKIQNAWRGVLSMRRDRDLFLNIKNSVIKIQNVFRCYLARKKAAEMQRRDAAIQKIQANWRATLLMRKQSEYFFKLRNSTIILQSHCRKVNARKFLTRLRQEDAASKILQRKWRAKQEMHKAREGFLCQKKAIAVIQRFFKCLLAKGMLSKLKKERGAAIVIQRRWKAVLAMRKKRQEFRLMKKSAIVIQCAMRQFLAKKKLKRLLEERDAAIAIQSHWRSWAMARKVRMQFLKTKEANLTIQRIFRGYLIRKRITDHKILRAKKRCIAANQRARRNPKAKICHRMNSALAILLQAKGYDTLFSTLEDLDNLSKLLPYCCERISGAGGTEILCLLIISSNRSYHAAFVQKFCINILLNLIKNPSTRCDTCYILASPDMKCGSAIEMMVNVLSRFRDKGGHNESHILVFCAACTLLIEFCRDQENVEILKSKTSPVDMIRYINRETTNRIKTKVRRTEEAKRERQRESVGYISLSSALANCSVHNHSSLLDTTTREASFVSNMDARRVSTPKNKRKRGNAENQDPSGKRKPHPSPKKSVVDLFGDKSVRPKLKESIMPQKATWHTNIPIRRSKKVAKPQSPKFQASRSKKMVAGASGGIPFSSETKVPLVRPSQELRKKDVKKLNLTDVEYDAGDPVSCINALSDILV